MNDLWYLIGGSLAVVVGALAGAIGPALASRIRYGRLPKPDDK